MLMMSTRCKLCWPISRFRSGESGRVTNGFERKCSGHRMRDAGAPLQKKMMPYAISLMSAFILHRLNCAIRVVLMQPRESLCLYDVAGFSMFM